MLKIALLDDYAKVALQSANWSVLQGKAQITVFDRHLSEDEAATALQPLDVLCTIRETDEPAAQPVPAIAQPQAGQHHRDVPA